MDPAKRICLKNLPEDCTKREIAELIKARTGAQPHSIDLGLDAAGGVRRYAHFSCEGAKKVLEVIGTGVALRDAVVHAHPAKMHYSFRYAEARRKREREEEEEKKSLEDFWTNHRARFLARTNNGELPPKEKPPRDFYFSKRKYATVASELADKLRKAHKAGGAGAGAGADTAAAGGGAAAVPQRGRRQQQQQQQQQHYHQPRPHVDVYAPLQEHQRYPQPPPAPVPVVEAAAENGGVEVDGHAGASPHAKHPRREKGPLKKHKKAKVEKQAPAPPPPPPPPQPSKEERKLTGLQAKLAALKEKMNKK